MQLFQMRKGRFKQVCSNPLLLSHIILRNFATIMKELVEHTNEECVKSIKSAKDALYVLNGK